MRQDQKLSCTPFNKKSMNYLCGCSTEISIKLNFKNNTECRTENESIECYG